MYAIIRSGGKQYRVEEGQTLLVEKDILSTLDGENVRFDEVLMVGGDEPKVGSPVVEGASVSGKVVRELRGDKIIVFKKKRRKQYKRKHGHRQDLVQVRVESIQL